MSHARFKEVGNNENYNLHLRDIDGPFKRRDSPRHVKK